MALLNETLRPWIAFWSNLLSAFALILLALMLIVQQNGWMILLMMFGVLVFHTAVTMYDLHHQGIERRQRMAFR